MSDRIGVIGGTGTEGRGLALRLAAAGADVVIGSRDPARAVEAAARLSNRAGRAIAGAANVDAVARCGVVILSVPFAHAGEILASCGGSFAPGALLVDVTVPLVFEGRAPRLVPPPAGSAAEDLRARLPGHVALACAFKTVPAWLLERLEAPLGCDEFVCGDSPEARQRAAALVERIPGLRAIDAGPLPAARALEHMTWLAILLNQRYRRHEGRFRVVGL